MKKTFLAISMIMVCIYASTFMLTGRAAWAAPGDSAENPIPITDAAGLDRIRDDLDKYYVLEKDIDLSTYLASGAGYI